jgi:hypothetical protein
VPSFDSPSPPKIENKKYMTAKTALTFDSLQTPYDLTADTDPRHYLRGVAAWPGMPTHVCRRHLKPEDRKAIHELFAAVEQARKTEVENDSIAAREHAQQLFKSTSEEDILKGEALNRKSMTMDMSKALAAKTKQRELREEGKQLAVRLALEMSEALLPEFLEDAISVEQRLIRGGIPLSHEIYNAGQPPIVEWELWQDALLSNAFAGCWFLKWHWPVEFQEERYSPGAWADFLKEISKED